MQEEELRWQGTDPAAAASTPQPSQVLRHE
jgi:hypothetical protein